MSEKITISEKELRCFEQYLIENERCRSTIEKYLSDVRQFGIWINNRELSKETLIEWRETLITSNYKFATINGKIAAINCFLRMTGYQNLTLKSLKIQRQIFRNQDRVLTKEEYVALIKGAEETNNERLLLIMETICSTGIRVSELQNVTVEALLRGNAEIRLKGKIRVIMFPQKLIRKLLKYVKKSKIDKGPIFITRSGNSISRKQVWAEMKSLCQIAKVASTKVFPHNLRHLFARCFYKACKDIVRLADILGHSNVDTTRIYLISSGYEHIKMIERLNLII